MNENEEIKQIKDITNKIIKSFVYTPWCVYTKFITKDEVNLICIENDKAIRLSARIWLDNYYNEPVHRARLDLYIYTIGEEGGGHLFISSQYSWDIEKFEKGIIIQEPQEYLFIERVIETFYKINLYHKKIKELEKESADISPGSPKCELEHEFFNKEWEI